MSLELIALIISLVIGATVVLDVIYTNNVNKKVMATSKRISALFELNKSTDFHQIKSKFEISKRYDNKSNYMKIEPAYLMAAEIRKDVNYFVDYSVKIRENREKLTPYKLSVQKIYLIENDVNVSELKVPKKMYDFCEQKLLSKHTLSPTVDCQFNVKMSYSSPKGKVNLSKSATLNFEDMFVCLESVSRSHLDRSTYSKLAAVERGEVSDSLRYDILHRDNFTCVICGASSKQGVRLHVDHIVPVSKGGKSIPSNLRTLCERCNIGKSNKIEGSPYTSASPVNTLSLTCERCGAKLLLRKGKYGDFYGCSNYPRCNFTKTI